MFTCVSVCMCVRDSVCVCVYVCEKEGIILFNDTHNTFLFMVIWCQIYS